MHIGGKSLSYVSRSESLTRVAEHLQGVSCSLVFEQIRTSDKNGWEHVSRLWVHFLVCEWFRTTDKRGLTAWRSGLFFGAWADQNHWQELNMHPDCEFTLYCLRRSDPMMRMPEHVSSGWVCSSSELLMRMAEHVSSEWVYSPVFEQIRTTDENGWTWT